MTALKRTGGEGRAQTFVPTEAWIEAFTEQVADADTYEAMKRYGIRRGLMLANVRKIEPAAYAVEIVQDIIDDTLEGRIAWDPDRVSLRKHVLDAIKSRSRHAYRKALREVHVSLEDLGERVLDAQVATRTRENEAELADRKRAMSSIFAIIRERTHDDVEVQLLLDAYERGAEERASVLSLGTLTKLQYDAARKRLDRLIETLPNLLMSSAKRSR